MCYKEKFFNRVIMNPVNRNNEEKKHSVCVCKAMCLKRLRKIHCMSVCE